MNHIALIAGMGPDAGADALVRFLAACRRELVAADRAITDQAYPPHVLVQHPIPDRTAALLHGGYSPVPGLVGAVGSGKAAGAQVMGIACNTAHFWHEDLETLFPDLDILHIANETAYTVAATGAQTCAVLATEATQQGGLYRKALSKFGLTVMAQPHGDERAIHQAIFDIKAGNTQAGAAVVRATLDRLLQRVDTVILGCTELGLAVDASEFHNKVVDAADVLASALAAKAYGTYETKASTRQPPLELS